MPICRILLILLAVATLPASEALVHVVRKGENLTTIAKSYGVTVDSVKKANNLRNVDKIVDGQKLEIPGTAPKYIEYKVRKGESLSSIAAQHGLKAKEIGDFNGIRNLNKIRVGQVIRIPSKSGVTTPKYTRLPWSVRNALDKIGIEQGQWKSIVVHHSGTTADRAVNIARFHREERRMENGLAYHFVIENGTRGTRDGDIYIGNRWEKQLHGGHMKLWAHNQVAIGICLIGNFEKTRPKSRQLDQLEALIDYLRSKTGIPAKNITTHKLMHPKHTLCPGRYFPTDQLNQMVR